MVSYLSRTIICDGTRYIFRKIKDEALSNVSGSESKENYFIATKERAFWDCIYLYKNYHFDNLEFINWDLCFKIVEIYNNKKLVTLLNSYKKKYA